MNIKIVLPVLCILIPGCLSRSSEENWDVGNTKSKMGTAKALYGAAKAYLPSQQDCLDIPEIVCICQEKNLLPNEAIEWDKLDIDAWGNHITCTFDDDYVVLMSLGRNGLAENGAGDDIVVRFPRH